MAALPGVVSAQEGPSGDDSYAESAAPSSEQTIDFAADSIDYDADDRIVTARGNVVVVRGPYRVRADEITYDRNSGEVLARGRVEGVDLAGNQLYAEEVALEDDLRDGAIEGFLLILGDGGRLAATRGRREDNVSTVEQGVYSPCRVVDGSGCPREPLWQIKASRVVHDPERQRISYQNPRFEFLGIPVLSLPALSHADRVDARADGILIPDFQIDNDVGVSATLPYFLALNEQSDLTLRPTVYTEVAPSLGAEYRRAAANGAFQLGGIATVASIERRVDEGEFEESAEQFRGYIYGNGRFQHDERWSSEFGLRLTTDDTFLRRYEISRDTTLRNFARTEMLDSETYLSAEAWAFQGLAQDDEQGLIPVALPLLDFSYRPAARVAGGRAEIEASSATVTRADGMDTFRLTSGASWWRQEITSLGQVVTFEGLVRGDVYRTDEQDKAVLEIYSAENGWEARAIPAAAIDVKWPLVGPALGGTQMITPRVQLSASPRGLNDGIPNEDSRAVDLESVNLFDISRFPGHDRWEGGMRVTYGAAYRLQRPRFLFEAEVGQSYSLDDNPSIAPAGTGLTEQFSDFVGRNELRVGSWLDLVHRYRLDKDGFQLRRNEVDLTVGSERDYLVAGYLQLNRDIGVEDLADREEVRLGGRFALTRYWSAFGSIIVDLTDEAESALSLSDGFEPIRHRVGIGYEDECFEFGITWRRDYVETDDLKRGNTLSFSVSLKNIGG
ncbi:organic solvent tolerance protein [Pacificimonas flava]|uniref:LPS-assembly protein LptD n=2 Tax=Pacificimonas TaxID=1960290 RepID=A0A219BAG1_9SPHN|nr:MULTISPECIES: LPS assembly protein LptD [Pacificimonas]MBZ6378555.1 LPS-assembly protein LptD [Pacificimonas aurantium]OWV34768.1 organic solvent tolerance protein [Pacificimonas flava]